MTTQPAFSMPAEAGRTCQEAQQSPRIHRFFGASGTAKEWVEDFGAVLVGVAVIVLLWIGLALIAPVGR